MFRDSTSGVNPLGWGHALLAVERSREGVARSAWRNRRQGVGGHPPRSPLDLPDDLLIEAKTLAARRKTTLKAIVESALRREIRPAAELENPDPEKFEVGPLGFLVIKRRPGDKPVTSEMIRAIQDEIDEEDFQKAMHPNGQ